MQNDPLKLRLLLKDWKHRRELKNGLAILSMDLLRSLAHLYDLFFCPRLFVRYLAATASLQIIYEVYKRLRRLFMYFKLKSTVEGRQIQNLKSQLENAKSFAERQAIGLALDKLEGKEEWKQIEESHLFEYQRVINKTKMYKRLIQENDITGLMFYLRAGLLRKHWGLGNPRLYSETHGTQITKKR